MKVEIKVPSLGESVAEATVSRIIQPSGSFVQQDQEILELETDKVNHVLYAPHTGQLKLTVAPQQTVKVGQVIGSVDTDVPSSIQPSPASAPPPTVSPPISRMTPEETPPLPSFPNRRRMTALRKTIADRLVEVKNTTAMLTTFNDVDMTHIIEIRSREKENFEKKQGGKLGFMSFFVKATVEALKAFPDVHAYIEGEEIVQFPNFDIGVAVSTDKGLMVPVLRDCDTASLGEIEKQIENYAKKAREGSISIEDLRGGSFTLTNGGVFGSLLSTPILNPPQSGILGMHAIVKRPIAIEDEVVIRPMMYLALSYDHRIIDGKEAVQFLVHIKQSLEDPTRLRLEIT